MYLSHARVHVCGRTRLSVAPGRYSPPRAARSERDMHETTSARLPLRGLALAPRQHRVEGRVTRLHTHTTTAMYSGCARAACGGCRGVARPSPLEFPLATGQHATQLPSNTAESRLSPFLVSILRRILIGRLVCQSFDPVDRVLHRSSEWLLLLLLCAVDAAARAAAEAIRDATQNRRNS